MELFYLPFVENKQYKIKKYSFTNLQIYPYKVMKSKLYGAILNCQITSRLFSGH